MKTVLYHGGKDLELNYRENKPAKKGRWEFGCGLYLTNHLEEALTFAKGKNQLYQVELDLTTAQEITNVRIPEQDVYDFINKYVKASVRSELTERIKERNVVAGLVRASILNNLLIISEGLTPSNSINFTDFLVDHGADYSISSFAGFLDSQVLVVFNRELITSVSIKDKQSIQEADHETKRIQTHYVPQFRHVLAHVRNKLIDAEHNAGGQKLMLTIDDSGYSYLVDENNTLFCAETDNISNAVDLDITAWDFELGNWDGEKEPFDFNTPTHYEPVPNITHEYASPKG